MRSARATGFTSSVQGARGPRPQPASAVAAGLTCASDSRGRFSQVVALEKVDAEILEARASRRGSRSHSAMTSSNPAPGAPGRCPGRSPFASGPGQVSGRTHRRDQRSRCVVQPAGSSAQQRVVDRNLEAALLIVGHNRLQGASGQQAVSPSINFDRSSGNQASVVLLLAVRMHHQNGERVQRQLQR